MTIIAMCIKLVKLVEFSDSDCQNIILLIINASDYAIRLVIANHRLTVIT